METLNKLYTEQEAVDLAEKIMAAIRDKIKEQIANKFYEETEGWLHEVYANNKDKIMSELIAEITEQYVKEPHLYKFAHLRAKMWEENKSELVKTLTDEAITQDMENILMQYSHRDYHFNWQWKDGIVKVILNNWDKFKEDERIAQGFGREIERLKSQVSNLQAQLNEVNLIVNNNE